MTRRQRRRAARAFDRVREQLRLTTTVCLVAGDVIREQRRTHEEDLGRMAELVCQLLEADALNEELRASLARMTGRYAEAQRRLEEYRASGVVPDPTWSERMRAHAAVVR